MLARARFRCWSFVLGVTAAAASAQEQPIPAFGTRAEAVTVDVVVPSRPAVAPQDHNAVPTFAARAEAITVDVVVLDKQGHAVVDLAPNEFTLLEDGRAQTIVGFEQRALAPPGTNAAPIDDGTQAATNERSSAPSGRTLAFLIDDLGIEPLHMTDVAKALTRWLTEKADARDDVTLATTSGDTWWSDTVGDGRADFQAVLGRLKGKKKLASVQDAMGDWEAYNIDTLGSPIEPPVAPSGPPRGVGSCFSSSPTSSMLERVMDRWFRTGACICDPMAVGTSIRSCRSQALGRSREVYGAATQRGLALLGGVERFSLGLAGTRGRKSVIVLSEALLRDIERSAFERAVDASRRGNTAVSFVDVRGLIALPFYGADQTAPPNPGDVGVMTMEATVLETGGGEYMADATGGSMVRDTNDLADGVTRLADESSAYYLLGYQSVHPLDGRWHKLDVKVSRPGVKVRARRGYFATAAAPSAGDQPAKEKKAKPRKGKGPQLPVRAIDPALAVGGERDGIPLRIAPYVFETNSSGGARVLVAVEVGTAALAFRGSDKQRTAQLDITILGVSRDHPKTVPIDAHVGLSVDAQAVGGWWTFTRELNLPHGVAQIRALVRDTASGRSGLVTQRLEIPRSDAAYMSTPMLSDRIQSGSGSGGVSRLVPAAHRRFQRRGYLYCAYEVYVAPGRELHRIPQVTGGYTLQDQDGQVIDLAPPTPIAMALGAQISRLIALPLERLDPGRYDLTLQIQDNEIGLNLEARQVFWVEPAAAAQAQPN
jgi:VWFA-related protein